MGWDEEFRRSHGIGLSTLNRHLKKQKKGQSPAEGNEFEPHRLGAVEEAATVASETVVEFAGSLIALLSNGRRVEVGQGFDGETLGGEMDHLGLQEKRESALWQLGS